MSAADRPRSAFVSVNEEKQRMLLSFRLDNELVKDCLVSIDRNLDEALEIALARLRRNIEIVAAKKLRKKKKKTKNIDEPEEEPFDIKLHLEDAQGKLVELFLTNREAFKTGNILSVGESKFLVIVNAPTIIRLSLPKLLLEGCPALAYVQLDHGNLQDCEFRWWITPLKYSVLENYAVDDVCKVSNQSFVKVQGETSNFLNLRPEHVGRKIMVECTPRRGDIAGVRIREISPNVVTSMAENKFFDERLARTNEILPDNLFRVVSYNLLANVYARTTYSKKLLFGYCENWALSFDYRKLLLIREILGYNGDLICLQEVDRSMFTKELYPCLSLLDFDGVYCEKSGEAAEGVAIFFRNSKFELVEKYECHLSQAIQKEQHLIDIKEAVNANEKLRLRMKDKTQVLLHLVLRHKSSEKHLIVGNTHLYFHPLADNIRLIQALAAVRILEKTAERFTEADQPCSMMFCGDFNSSPEFGVYQLFTTGYVPKDSEDWASNPEEKVIGLAAKIKQCWKSACGTPEFTNYTAEFKSCLDYIFHSEELEVDTVVPLPPEEVLADEKHKALPSPIFPSDHLALVASLKFKE